MSKHNVGLYIDYESLNGGGRIRIHSHSFDGNGWIEAHNKTAPLGRIYLLKCKCGSNDWTDNGRSISEFECQGCGQFVQVADYDSMEVEARKSADRASGRANRNGCRKEV